MNYENGIRNEEKKLLEEIASMKFSFKKILKAIELDVLLHADK